jgi:uncharacterized protein
MNKDARAPDDSPLASMADDERELCGDLDIRIDRDGSWYYHGSLITRKELVCLFASVLTRDEAGDFWLITPTEMGRIEVEDAPFIAVEMFVGGLGNEQHLSFRTNVDTIVSVDSDHPIHMVTNGNTGESTPYLTVSPGMEARIARSVYYEMVDLAVEEKVDGEPMFGVWSTGTFFAMAAVDEAEHL